MMLPHGRTIGEELAALDAFSRLLDSRFGLFGIKFGLDSVLGLVPVVGDAATGAVGLHALATAWRLKLPAARSCSRSQRPSVSRSRRSRSNVMSRGSSSSAR